jgi:hypothetical protein
LDDIDSGIRRLKVEFDRFFNRAVPIPPEDLRQKVQDDLGRLRNSHLRTSAERFRLKTLEAQYNALNELFNRRIREAELSSNRASRAALDTKKGPDPYSGIVLDGIGNHSKVEALYNELYQSSGRSKQIDFASFEGYLERQIVQLREKTGCSSVKLRIEAEGQELKLKAKPIKPARGKSLEEKSET